MTLQIRVFFKEPLANGWTHETVYNKSSDLQQLTYDLAAQLNADVRTLRIPGDNRYILVNRDAYAFIDILEADPVTGSFTKRSKPDVSADAESDDSADAEPI